jgi:hypothetical protein
LLDDGGFAFGRVLAISTRCFCCFFLPFGLLCEKKELASNTKLQTILEEKGEGKITTFVLFFLSIFFVFFSLIFFHTQSPRGLQIKHKKQMCFQLQKNFFPHDFFLSCVTVIMMVMCIGCVEPDVAFGFARSLPLLHVTWLMSLLNKQSVTDTRQGMRCTFKHRGSCHTLTCRWHWKIRVRGSRIRLSGLASSIYILYAMQQDFSCHVFDLFQQHDISRFYSKAFENCRGFLFSSLCLHTAVVHPPRAPKSVTSAFLLRSPKVTSLLSKGTMISRPETSPKKAQDISHLEGYCPVSRTYCAFP